MNTEKCGDTIISPIICGMLEEGSLDRLAEDLEKFFNARFGNTERIGFSVTFLLPPRYDEVFWISTLSSEDTIKIFRETASKIDGELDKQGVN